MKTARLVSVAGAVILMAGIFLGLTFFSRAQMQSLSGSATHPDGQDSVVRIAADLEGLSLVPPEQVPPYGTFWIVTSEQSSPPYPFLPPQYDPATTPVYALDDSGNQFLVDGGGAVPQPTARQTLRGVSSAMLVQAQMDTVLNLITQFETAEADRQMRAMAQAMGLDLPMPGDGGTNSDGGNYTNSYSTYTFDHTQLWLDITNISNGLAALNLHNATNEVYAVWSTTNLLTPFTNWLVEREVWPTNADVMPFTLPTLGRQALFMRAEDWTGVDSDGDGIPDWWIWKYFGNLNETATNLDSQGNTLGYDYACGYDPNVIQFSIAASNNCVNTSYPGLQLNISAGTPSYYAVLVDSTNFATTNWAAYTSSSVSVNLGSTEGWHEVWIGLRGLPSDAQQTWEWKRLKLDLTPPQLVITGPTNGTVNVPMIQLTGYSPEALSSLSYDLTNASGLQTNQQVLMLDQVYSTNTFEFTTNTFQGYDIALTNGLNTITLHATDLAGNVATLTTNIVCATNANPPTVALLWPQDGMQMSGNTFTIQGQVDDPTATVSVTGVDANGNTNYFNGRTGRDGIFWIENVPLNSGTNDLALTASNAAGGTTTNFSLVQSSVGLTVNAVQAGDTTVNGSLDTEGYTVWVNGTQATDNGDGTWTAQITPIGIGGGLVQVTAIPVGGGSGQMTAGRFHSMSSSSEDPNINTQTTVEPPQGVYVSAYHYNVQQNYWVYVYYPSFGSINELWHDILDWQDGQGGNETEFDYDDWRPDAPESYATVWPTTSWPQAMTNGIQIKTDWSGSDTNTVSAPVLAQEHCDAFASWIASYNLGNDTERRTVDTEMKLATGGPLGSTQKNLWVISASATAYTNLEDTVGTNVPFNQISIGSLGNLDTNGNLYVVLPDNDPEPITPKVPGTDIYKFPTPTATKYTLAITANGILLSNDVVAAGADFCVGQYITFDIVGLPNHNNNDDVAKWTLPGTFVNTNSDPNCDLFYEKNTTFLTRHYSTDKTISTYCWYVLDAQQATVSVDIYYDFRVGGKVFKETITGNFNVHRPTTTFSKYDDGTPTVMVTNGLLALGYNRDRDMSFKHQINPGNFSGHAGYTQLVSGEVQTHPYAPLMESTELDTREFPRGIPSISTNSSDSASFFDGPNVSLADNDTPTSEDLNFSTYLLFKADAGPGPNIYVPLRLVTWNVNDSATYKSTGWSVDTGNPVAAPSDTDCITFPHWTKTYGGWWW